MHTFKKRYKSQSGYAKKHKIKLFLSQVGDEKDFNPVKKVRLSLTKYELEKVKTTT